MLRHSKEAQRELDQYYLLVAEELVAHGGWEAGTVRKIAEAAGTSRGPIHDRFKGFGLKKALVDEAYLHLLRALLAGGKELTDVAGMLKAVVDYVRSDDETAPLMVQVAAVMAAREAPGGDELRNAVILARVRTARVIETRFGDKLSAHQRGRQIRAESLVKWYEAICMTLVMDIAASDPDLISLAHGHPGLG